MDHTGPRVRARSALRFHISAPSRSNFLTLRSSRGVSDPWAAETAAAEWKYKNVYIDTSTWSPKYYAPELITFANTTGREKVMFGTNFPQLGWKDCVGNFDRYLVGTEKGFKEKVVREFMGGIALRVLGLPPVKLDHLKSNL